MESASEKNENTKKRRKRPYTKLIRSQLKSKLESALLSQKSQILGLFKLDEKDIASLFIVLEKLGLKDSDDVKKLSPFALRSISNITKIFTIEGPDKELVIRFNKKKREILDDMIVYVDNLPAACTLDRLKRRASVFGTVVNVHLPKPRRIRNRYNRMVNNVGYGFVQFSTVKAAKRFIFKYAANSHLRRHKHSRSRRRKVAKDSNKNRDKRASSEGPISNFDSSMQDSEIPEGAELSGATPTPDNSLEYEYALALASDAAPYGDNATTYVEKTDAKYASTSSKVSIDFVRSVSVDEYRERKFTEVSESGNDTDLDIVEKKRKCRRRKKHRHGPPSISLTAMLKRIQVFPLKQYKELRAEYLHLKKDRMAVLKKIVQEEQEKLNLTNGQSNKLNEPKLKEKSRHKRSQKRKKLSGKKRLMIRAFKIKEVMFSEMLHVGQKEEAILE